MGSYNYIKGDVTEVDFDFLVHGCNAQGRMASGVAKAISDKWPVVKQNYVDWFQNSGLYLGDIQTVTVGNNKFVINAITQEYYGYDKKKYVSYDAVDKAMQSFNRLLRSTGRDSSTKIVMPMIGAGLGGGNWEIIKEIILQNLYDYNVDFYYLD